MRIFFACLVLASAALTGCYKSHRLGPAPVPTTDAGEMPTPDGGVMEDGGTIEPDGGVITPDAGTFALEADEMRPSAILIAGGDVWQQTASYRVPAGESLASIVINLDGDAADIQEVAIAADGSILGTARFPSGTDTATRISLDEPFVTPRDATRTFMVWVKIPSVVSNAASGGVRDGFPMSGDTFRLGVYAVERYIGSALVSNGFDPVMGNEFVIRKSRPTFTRRMLPNFMFSDDTDQDLYRFQVSADAAGSIGLRAVRFSVGITSATGRVCNVRIRRGSIEIPRTEYFLRDGRMGGSESCWSMLSGAILIYFFNEETVTGSGNEYTVFGTPSGFVAGDSIVTTLVGDDADDGFVTGYIGGLGGFGQSIDTSPWGSPSGTCNGDVGASLIWSDLSDVPHLAANPCGDASLGSRDWTNGYLIEDLTQTQTISR